MTDWRWVTEIRAIVSPNLMPPIEEGKWVDLDGVDMIMPLNNYHRARTRLTWMTSKGPVGINVAEQIDPTYPGEANNNPQKEE